MMVGKGSCWGRIFALLALFGVLMAGGLRCGNQQKKGIVCLTTNAKTTSGVFTTCPSVTFMSARIARGRVPLRKRFLKQNVLARRMKIATIPWKGAETANATAAASSNAKSKRIVARAFIVQEAARSRCARPANPVPKTKSANQVISAVKSVAAIPPRTAVLGTNARWECFVNRISIV